MTMSDINSMFDLILRYPIGAHVWHESMERSAVVVGHSEPIPGSYALHVKLDHSESNHRQAWMLIANVRIIRPEEENVP